MHRCPPRPQKLIPSLVRLLGRKTMTNLDSILKSRDITLQTKVYLVKATVFPIVMYGCESWITKKAEHRRVMLLNCGVGENSWESLGLQGDQTSQSWRKSILNIHCKDWCWSWSSNPLATWYKKPTHWKRPWCWERLKAGEGGDRGWDGWMASLTWHEFEQVPEVGNGQGGLACCTQLGCKESNKTEWLSFLICDIYRQMHVKLETSIYTCIL